MDIDTTTTTASSRDNRKKGAIDFECTRCGECCSNLGRQNGVMVFTDEVRRIAESFGEPFQRFYRKHFYSKKIKTAIGKVEVHLIRSKHGKCHFLTGNLCSIHAIKPEQCKRGPFGFFWDGVRRFSCMEDVFVPPDWQSTKTDLSLVKKHIFRKE